MDAAEDAGDSANRTVKLDGDDAAEGGATAAAPLPRRRGHVGGVLADVFKDLYEPPPKGQGAGDAEAEAEAAEGDAADGAAAKGGEAEPPAEQGDNEADATAAAAAAATVVPNDGGEDAEIQALNAAIEEEQVRIGRVATHLDERSAKAKTQDQEHADFMKQRWGLVVGDHIPVPDSKLRHLLDPPHLGNEGLLVPRHMMEGVEKWIEIKKGTEPQHDNLLSISKPEEPHHYKETAALKLRGQARNAYTRFSEAQRKLLSQKIEERRLRRPPMPPSLNTEQRENNKKIVKEMQAKVNFLKNPRFLADKGHAKQGKPCPFWFSPDVVIFRDYDVGAVYELSVEFRNVAQVGRSIRVLPCKSAAFSIGALHYERDLPSTQPGGRGPPPGVAPTSFIAPGCFAKVSVRFAPQQLADETDQLMICTELGDYPLPVLARRRQPQLVFEETVDCGCILAGSFANATLHIADPGGEGSFRLITGDPTARYETFESGETRLVTEYFAVEPASFYLERGQAVDVAVSYCASSVGRHVCDLHIECDNGEKWPVKLTAIADALRLEMQRWPTLQRPLAPRALEQARTSPWALTPWMLNWLAPGAQVGCAEEQTIDISNGGHLPSSVEWRFLRPPDEILSRMALGAQQRLTDDILRDINNWERYGEAELGRFECPFSVEPAHATIAPFSTANFRFTFVAHPPVGHRATAFACLVAKEVPSSRACLLSYRELLDQKSGDGDSQALALDRPEGYSQGLPLFGGSVCDLIFDAEQQQQQRQSVGGQQELRFGSCAVTAICLQGASAAPKVSCQQRLLAYPGEVLPFVSHTKELVLKNAGPRPAYFKVRLSSDAGQVEGDSSQQLWVISPQEAGIRELPPEGLLDAPPMEFGVSLTKSLEAELGVEIDDYDGRLIISACGGGMADEWNAEHPPQLRIRPGDEIIEANGDEVDVNALAELYQGLPGGGRLDLLLRRSRGDYLQLVAGRLASEWVPLPPAPSSVSEAGAGALATAAVFPTEGHIPPGGVVKVQVMLRAPRETDVNSQLVVDLPLGPEDPAPAAPALRVPLRASVRAPRVELRETSFVDFGVVRAHARHTSTMRVSNPTDLPLLVRLRCRDDEGGEAAPAPAFPVESHQEIVDLFLSRLDPAAQSTGAEFPLPPAMALASRERSAAPWVRAGSGCLDLSGRARPGGARKDDEEAGGLPDSASFVFSPGCIVVWPKQSAEVAVTLRAGAVGQLRALLEAVGFDSRHSQCIDAVAEVQLPRLRMSTQLVRFPVTYTGTQSEPFDVELCNDSEMLASFDWRLPKSLPDGGLRVAISPPSGEVPPGSSLVVKVVATPMADEAGSAKADVLLVIGEVLQPLALRVSAQVYGLEVDYAVVPEGQLPPMIRHEPRDFVAASKASSKSAGEGDDEGENDSVSHPVTVGRAPKSNPPIDFGELELQRSKSIQLVLYNRSAVPTPWAVRIERNPAYEPPPEPKGNGGGRSSAAASRITSKLETTAGKSMESAATAISFQSPPQPAGQGRTLGSMAGTSLTGGQQTSAAPSRNASKFEPGSRRFASRSKNGSTGSKRRPQRFLLDDRHEKQAFRSADGAEFAQQKEDKKQGNVALQHGRGWAVKVEPASDWLQPFGKTVVTLTCFSDLPGPLEDELVLSMDRLPAHSEGKGFRIPVRLMSKGNPLYLPDQQVGLCKELDPPRLSCGTIVPVEKQSTRPIKVSNNSAAKMVLSWAVFGKAQLGHRAEGRRYIGLRVCRSKEKEALEADDAGDARGRPSAAPIAIADAGAPGAGSAGTGDDDGEGDTEGGAERGDGDEDEVASAIVPVSSAAVAAAAGAEEDEGDSEEEELPFRFRMWAESPPEVPDPFALPLTGDLPLKIEPQQAVIPPHGSAIFTVTMLASKATVTADGHYQYKLVGKGRFTEDRQALLDAAAAGHEPGSVPRLSAISESTMGRARSDEVRDLPDIKIDAIDDSDSDAEPSDAARGSGRGSRQVGDATLMPSSVATGEIEAGVPPREPEHDVISTLIIDCVGDVIIPRLSVDKKEDEAADDFGYADAEEVALDGTDASKPLKCAMFKFFHSAVPHPVAPRQLKTGAAHGGAVSGAQIPGIVSIMTRHVVLTNRNPCSLYCCFRIEGPFRLLEISQVGKHPIRLQSEDLRKTKKRGGTIETMPPRQLFSIEKGETISLQVDFVPELIQSHEWTESQIDHFFNGSVIIEYPREAERSVAGASGTTMLSATSALDGPTDLQRVHLSATSRRPAVRVVAVPRPELDRPLKAPTTELGPVIVEFGRVHVASSMTRSRAVLLLNITNVIARWALMHVGRKRALGATMTSASASQEENEDDEALDDKDAFHFDIASGELLGPSKDVLVPGSQVRMPRYFPLTPALPHALPAEDEHHFEPLKLMIAFKPKKNELYKCRYRMHVEGGISADLICRGHGSYNEDDDIHDFVES